MCYYFLHKVGYFHYSFEDYNGPGPRISHLDPDATQTIELTPTHPRLKVTVKSKDTKEPLAGVKVTLRERGESTALEQKQTDSKGLVVFLGLDSSSVYVVSFNKEG